MNGPIQRYLTADHVRLDGLLGRSTADPTRIDFEAYGQFRAGILEHIGIEEKILLPAARRLRGGEPLAVARLLRIDHATIAALLVPTPTPQVVTWIREVLALHNPLEEDAGGLYDTCDALAASEMDDLMARVRAAPEVPLMPYSDGERAHRNIEHWLRQARDVRRGGPGKSAAQ